MTRWSQDHYDEYMLSLKPSAANPTPTDNEVADEGPESQLQKKIEQYCRDNGLPFFHDRSRKKNTPGWPDLTICLSKGVVLFLELKAAKGVMKPPQKRIRQQMVFLGHQHFVIKSHRKFLKIINKHNALDDILKGG